MSMKNSNNTIGNRTRDLPACSAVPQPTAPPRAPVEWYRHDSNKGLIQISKYNNELFKINMPQNVPSESWCGGMQHFPPPRGKTNFAPEIGRYYKYVREGWKRRVDRVFGYPVLLSEGFRARTGMSSGVTD